MVDPSGLSVYANKQVNNNMKKKSFVLHIDSLDVLDDLSDEQAGKLFKAIKAYQKNDGMEVDSLVKIAFSPFKNQFTRDDEKSRSGAHHWNWKGGISSENHRLRNSTEYKEWRAAVFTRDEYACQKCFTIGGVLNAHHVKPWAEFIADRFDVDNGLTLCKECHVEVHNER